MPEALGVTRALARYSLSASADLPAAIVAQAARAFLNHVGCTIGGVTEPASRIAIAQADLFSGARRATVLGRRTRLDALHAAYVNTLQSCIQTFDDTHLASVIHPTGPIASAMLALIEHDPACDVDGSDFLAALSFGLEVACRVGAVLTAPGAGLHLGVFTTGIAGAIGAAAGTGRLLGLDEQRQAWAIGIAAAQAGGLRVSHATMSGGLIPALGSRTGLSAALLAQKGFDCSEAGLEGRNGLLPVFAPDARADDLVTDLGERFEMADLAYKPYPCGIVIHPAIDACLALASERPVDDAVEQVRLRVHPLTLQLTGLKHPLHAMDAKVSVAHWCAAALLRRRAGMTEATDEAVHDPDIEALRGRVEATADASLDRDEAYVQLTLASGRNLAHHIPHARGSRERPLTGAELADKFLTLVVPVLDADPARALLDRCRSLPDTGRGGLAALLAGTVPSC